MSIHQQFEDINHGIFLLIFLDYQCEGFVFREAKETLSS